MTINERIAALRQVMAQHQLAAYLIPSSDPHQSEYVADHWKGREWISGFTGSTATVIVTPDHAGLWTDSRYFLQAEQELADSEMELHKLRIPHTPEYLEWLATNVPTGSTIGCDGLLFSVQQIRLLTKALHAQQVEIRHDLDLLAPIWTDRPPLPAATAFELPEAICGQSRADKLAQVRQKMAEAGTDYHLISDLADIAWVLNLRSSDIEYNPVVIGHLVIGPQLAYLFIDEVKIPAALKAALQTDGVALKPYQGVKSFLQQLPDTAPVLIDPKTTSIDLYQSLEEAQIVRGAAPSVLMRAIKNETEIAFIREAMLKDGVALTRLYRWLEATLPSQPLSEYEVAQKLDDFRREQGDYHCESFSAIVGYAGNGAIVHYRPDPETSAQLKTEGLLLLDSGGQYLQGTTDITRTTALGPATEEQKRNFTLVLKGHIGLAQLRFPQGTRGNQMEILARQHLWAHGLNYGHGTGHGVGFFLNVHEGPQALGSGQTAKAATVFQPGMLTSNEPGYYQTDAYGIRIENLILCVEDRQTDYGQFLKFETMTLFPIDLELVDEELLTAAEKDWLDGYHQEVYDRLSPRLTEEERNWLRAQCGLRVVENNPQL